MKKKNIYIYIIKLFKYYGYLLKLKTYYLIFILLRLFDKISLKFIINHQIGKKRSSNNEGYRVVKEIIKIIRVNKDKRVK